MWTSIRQIKIKKILKPLNVNDFSILCVTSAGLAALIPQCSALKIAQIKKRSSKLGVFS